MALAAVGRARSCAAARVRLAGRAGLGAFLLVALSAAAFGQQPLELPQSVPRQIFTFGPEFLKAATVVAGSWVLAARGEGEHLPGMLLVQRAVNNAYNVIAMPGPIYEDLDIHVRFMPISGRSHGGLSG